MIYIIKQKGLYQNQVNSSLVFTCNCKMGYCFIIRSPSLFFNHLLSDLPFSRKNDRKKEKSVVSFTHEQNNICNQTQLSDITHVKTIICKQLFAGNVVGSQPMKR